MAAPTAPLRTLREGPCSTSEVCPAQAGAGTGARFRPQTPMQVGWEPSPGAPGIRFGVGAPPFSTGVLAGNMSGK